MTASTNSLQQQHYTIPEFKTTDEGGEELPLNLIALPSLRTNDATSTTNTSSNSINNSNNNSTVDILAYGGEDGKIYLLPNCYTHLPNNQDGSSTSPSNNNDNDILHSPASPDDNNAQLKSPQAPIFIKLFADLPRSIAISSDGLRIVIGFESGETTIFSYDDYYFHNSKEGSGGEGNVDKLGVVHHPFVNVKLVNEAIDKVNNGNGSSGADKNEDNSGEEEGGDDDDGFFGGDFTQSQDDTTTTNNNTSGVHEFDGPRSVQTIRHMAFDPRSSSSFKQYYLAIGSESADSPLRVVNVYDEQSASKWYLEEEGCDNHGGAGVRSVAYSTSPNNTSTISAHKQWLTTLGMDGKLTVWDVSAPLSLPENWEHLHSDFVTSVKVDKGSLAGSDTADKACHLVWGQVSATTMGSGGGKKEKEVELLLLPGKTNVQVRVIPSTNESGGEEEDVKCFKKQQFVMDLERGHKDTIVAMAFEPVDSSSAVGETTASSRKVVTAARDGKLLLWEMTCEEEEASDDDAKKSVVVGGSLVKELSMVRGMANVQGIPVITSIVWIGNVLYVAHEDGEISVVSVSEGGVLIGEEEKDAEAIGMEADLSGGEDDDSIEAMEDTVVEESSSNAKAKSRVLEDDEDEDDDLFQDDAAAAESAQQGKSGVSKFIDDEADAEDDDDTSMNAEKDTAGHNGDDDDDDDKTQPIAEDNDDDDVIFDNHNDPFDLDDVRASTNYSFPPSQPAFAPSSTPIGDSRRILCWNHMGVATLRPDVEIDGNNLVDISFHDNSGLVGGRRPITFTDNVGFILGTLGDEGGLFASDLMQEVDDDDEFDEDGLTAGLSEATRKAVKRSQKKLNGNDSAKGSSVYFHRFDTFGKTSDKDWVYALPDGERVLGCATGSGWCGVMTR